MEAMPPVVGDSVELLLEEPPRTGGGGPRGPRDHDPDGRGGGGDSDGHGDRESPDGLGLLGMRFMLVSVMVLFVTIGVAYFERSGIPQGWTPIRVPGFLWCSTLLIAASSVTLERARRQFKLQRANPYAHWLTATLVLGAAFLVSQILALRQLVGQGVYLRGNSHSSLFYVLTGTHGLHLLGGMAFLAWLLLRARRLEYHAQGRNFGVAALFWHFLDALWVGVFGMLLLWR
jgi:cytochrome c oxidase subunit III